MTLGQTEETRAFTLTSPRLHRKKHPQSTQSRVLCQRPDQSNVIYQNTFDWSGLVPKVI